MKAIKYSLVGILMIYVMNTIGQGTLTIDKTNSFQSLKSTIHDQSGQCNIEIDNTNTHVHQNKSGRYVFQSIIRHDPPFGNDDATHDVNVIVELPDNATDLNLELASINDIDVESIVNSEISINGNVVSISGFTLQRFEHLELQISSSNPCDFCKDNYSYTISALPSFPADSDLLDNLFNYTKQCRTSIDNNSISENQIFKLLKDDRIYLNTLNNHYLENKLRGLLCDKLRVNTTKIQRIKSIELYQDNKCIQKLKLNNNHKAIEISLPQQNNSLDLNRYFLKIKTR